MTTEITESCGTPGPLAIHGRALSTLRGEKVKLSLWSNREDTALRYEWRLLQSPEGSRQRVEQPSGESPRTARGCEQVYIDGTVPNFTADLPGHYSFEVRAVELSTGSVAVGLASLDVTVPSQGGAREELGCAASPALPLVLLGLMLLRRATTRSFRA